MHDLEPFHMATDELTLLMISKYEIKEITIGLNTVATLNFILMEKVFRMHECMTYLDLLIYFIAFCFIYIYNINAY